MISRTSLSWQVYQPFRDIQSAGHSGFLQNWNGPGLMGEACSNDGATSVAMMSNTLTLNGVPLIDSRHPSQRIALFSVMIVGILMPMISMASS
jgi:hypothetical protein